MSNESFNKREKEKLKQKKKEEKQKKKAERKKGSGDLDSMIAYVDEFGNLTDTPPDPTKKKAVSAEEIELGVPKRAEEEPDVPHKGVVAFFNHEKGFGFINETGTGERYFVHVNNLRQPISENDKVTFDAERGPKGLSAINVVKI
jgi:cold shock CspA family protein